MPDPNLSSRRAFYCQEMLWQSFSDLAMQRGCSVDVLINDAMSAYLQSGQGAGIAQAQSNYGRQQYQQGPMQQPMQQNPAMQQPMAAPQNRQQPYRQPMGAAPQPANISYPGANAIPAAPISPAGPQGSRVPPPTPASYRRPPSIFEEPLSEAPSPGGKPMVLASLAAPQQAPMNNMQQQPNNYGQMQQRPMNYGQPPLYIIFANQRYTVDKDKYIIGRSSQLADLVIRDGNISRKHCAVIYKNGAYYIKDLDSTNGIEFQGQRIDTKRIEEGDQFNICEFHFTFTYR
ncbi:MAG: FHA domain-containing protein [Proteobacteria bacterium]|nr:FHA domain-containing protein [Pseudomonadota bacterium]